MPAKFHLFIGARPNIPKASTVQQAFRLAPLTHNSTLVTIHTQQHSQASLTTDLCTSLDVEIDIALNAIKEDSDARRIATLLQNVDDYLSTIDHDDLVIATGDVNTALAVALAAARRGISVIHLEAGLRSGQLEPEEVNRKLITAASTFHLAVDHQGRKNLMREGVSSDRIFVVGNAHTEALIRQQAEPPSNLHSSYKPNSDYLLLFVHKWATTTDLNWLNKLWNIVEDSDYDVVCCIHPNAKDRFSRADGNLLSRGSFTYYAAIGYREFQDLLAGAACVVTDSAGVQEEAIIASVRCISVGPPTARPAAVKAGNTHVGFDLDQCRKEITMNDQGKAVKRPDFWDDRVSGRISVALNAISSSILLQRNHTWRENWIISRRLNG